MNIEQARDIPISVILNKLNFKVQQTKGSRDLYFSPLNAKRTLSLWVNRKTNEWRDIEDTWWCNGNPVEFVRAYLDSLKLDCTERDALNWLEDLNYVEPIKPVNEPRKEHQEDEYLLFHYEGKIKRDVLLEYGVSRGIAPNILNQYFGEVSIINYETHENSYALAMRNQAKGYELRNADFKGYIVQDHITFIQGADRKNKSINIFESAFDFASNIALQDARTLRNDAIILHSLNNLTKAANHIKHSGYRNCFTWMDNDTSGQEATRSWEGFCRNEGDLLHLPMNYLYETYKDVNAAHVDRLKPNRILIPDPSISREGKSIVAITSANEQGNNVNKDIYQEITDTLIKHLGEGRLPWLGCEDEEPKPIQIPKNAITGRTYNGINTVLLWGASFDKQYPLTDWASFKQWKTNNENIRKGEKGTKIVFLGLLEKPGEDETGNHNIHNHLLVFNRCQLTSYTPRLRKPVPVPKPYQEKIPAIDDFIENTLAVIEHSPSECFYDSLNDKIIMIERNKFSDLRDTTSAEKYYYVLMLEMIRWTGAAKRLDRKINNKPGTKEHAEEELICELGAAFMLAEFGITNPKKHDHEEDIEFYLNLLKDNKHSIFYTASEATKSIAFLKSLQPLKLSS